MPDLLIKETELNNFVNFVNNNLPTKFGIAILNFLEETAQTRKKENEPVTEEMDEKTS